jgi:tRNA wybutosine-synthesizing protein 1
VRSPSASSDNPPLEPPVNVYPREIYLLLKKQGYHWVGRHSAIKKCLWLHKSLTKNRSCYKEKFYGIKSHRCLQMSPAVLSCLTRCSYCWRVLPEDVGYRWDESLHKSWDNPEELVDGMINEQKRILSGYNSQVLRGRVDPGKYREALTPNQVAISLSGEPALYPRLAEMIRIFKDKSFTVFLVTSGVLPSALGKMREHDAEPTQLYVSITAPDLGTYLKVNRPINENVWHNFRSTLREIEKCSCTTVARITAIKCVNMDKEAIRHFTEMIRQSSFDYIEVKAYMHIGKSTNRHTHSNMPLLEEVEEFARNLAYSTGYRYKDLDSDSRVVLLSKH